MQIGTPPSDSASRIRLPDAGNRVRQIIVQTRPGEQQHVQR